MVENMHIPTPSAQAKPLRAMKYPSFAYRVTDFAKTEGGRSAQSWKNHLKRLRSQGEWGYTTTKLLRNMAYDSCVVSMPMRMF